MVLDPIKLIYNSIAKQAVISHNDDCKFLVFKKEEIPADIKSKINEQYDEEFLEDANVVLFVKGPIDKEKITKIFTCVDKALGEGANKMVEGDFKLLKIKDDEGDLDSSSAEDSDETPDSEISDIISKEDNGSQDTEDLIDQSNEDAIDNAISNNIDSEDIGDQSTEDDSGSQEEDLDGESDEDDSTEEDVQDDEDSSEEKKEDLEESINAIMSAEDVVADQLDTIEDIYGDSFSDDEIEMMVDWVSEKFGDEFNSSRLTSRVIEEMLAYLFDYEYEEPELSKEEQRIRYEETKGDLSREEDDYLTEDDGEKEDQTSIDDEEEEDKAPALPTKYVFLKITLKK